MTADYYIASNYRDADIKSVKRYSRANKTQILTLIAQFSGETSVEEENISIRDTALIN